MAKEILYSEVSKDFRIDEDGRLFRLRRGIDLREVVIKANSSDGYCDVWWRGKMYPAHRLMYSLYYQKDVPTNLVINHLNSNKLDNRKENLHLVKQKQPTQTKGVIMKSEDLQEQVNELSKEVKRLSDIITKLHRDAALTHSTILDAVVANATNKINEEVIFKEVTKAIDKASKHHDSLIASFISLRIKMSVDEDKRFYYWADGWDEAVSKMIGSEIRDLVRDNYEIALIPKKKG